ncbi:DALR anticodon-binding domain-containing protein 3-like [Oopsacas minuta]|uniref:DALR anticodon-binding domain-containing protein 3-like n=1 Tax=Oopsacas minuta TaxID=111878 RepID=A0AAV7JT44_9METZ|nr:DALR anticodon-binding domain-containing protein 3-like [Oopsacas minuta]
MACRVDSDPVQSPFILTELITIIQDILGFDREEDKQLYVKTSSDKGAVIFIPKIRKHLEQKLLELLPPPDNNSKDYQVFNFCEKYLEELIKTVNQKLPQKYIHHFDLIYNKKLCAITAHLHINELVSECMKQLTYLDHDKTSIPQDNFVIINICCIELGQEIHTCTLDGYRNNLFCLAMRNLLRLTGNSAVFLDSCEYRLDLKRVRRQAEHIYKRCQDTGSLLEGESKIVVQSLHAKLKYTSKSYQTQNQYQIQLRDRYGRYSLKIMLASIILLMFKATELQDTVRIVLYFSHKLRDLVLKSLHILYSLELINSSVDIITHSDTLSTHSEYTALMESRRDYLHKTLLERVEGEYSADNTSLVEKARKLCESTTKLDLLSQTVKHEIKLVSNDKIGTHFSMFVLYNYARMTQILYRFQQLREEGVYGALPQVSHPDFNLLELPNEWSIFVKYILLFPDLLKESSNILQHNSISNICNFLVSLTQHFSTYYSKTKILTQSGAHLHPKVFARIQLISSLKRVMEICFRILEISPLHQL